MKDAFRQSMAWLHAWAGLVVGWVLYFVFLTGTLGYFDTEIDRWMRPERPLASEPVALEDGVAVGLRRLEQIAPGAERWFISPAIGREDHDLRIFYQQRADARGNEGARGTEFLDAATGEPVRYRDTGGGQVLYQMHYALHYLPSTLAYWIVGACTMFMLVALVTGVIIHKKIFKGFFTFRPGKRQRSWLDAHNVLSVVALPFHLMITYSGLIFFAVTYMPLIVAASYGTGEGNLSRFSDEFSQTSETSAPAGTSAPLASVTPMLAQAIERWGRAEVRFVEIRHPGDANARVTVRRIGATPLRNSERLVFDGVSGQLLEVQQPVTSAPRAVRDVFLGLHEGLFAGLWLRWLYFLSGLLGTAMIGTGLVLWTVKRRSQQAKEGSPSIGLTFVERLNLGTIIGLPIGIAAYFWANRLIPADVSGRAQWEVHALFIAWALMLVHAHCRPRARAWREQLWVAGAALMLLPLLNVLTTERHLGVTLPRGDWVLAGVDLTLLAAGLAFAATALKLRTSARVESVSRRAGQFARMTAPISAENG